MLRKCTVFVAGLAMLALGLGAMFAQEKPAKDAKRDADKLAIEKLVKDSIQAFDKRDAAAIAEHWTADGEFISNDGEAIRGPAEIQKAYADYFKTLKGKLKM